MKFATSSARMITTLFILTCAIAFAQSPAPAKAKPPAAPKATNASTGSSEAASTPCCTPTPAEREHLESLAKDRVIYRQRLENLQLQFQAVQAQLARADAVLAAAGDDVRKGHAWPEGTTFNLDALAFTAPPPAAPQTKDEKKK
jgi:hypothetical protein